MRSRADGGMSSHSSSSAIAMPAAVARACATTGGPQACSGTVQLSHSSKPSLGVQSDQGALGLAGAAAAPYPIAAELAGEQPPHDDAAARLPAHACSVSYGRHTARYTPSGTIPHGADSAHPSRDGLSAPVQGEQGSSNVICRCSCLQLLQACRACLPRHAIVVAALRVVARQQAQHVELTCMMCICPASQGSQSK
jgi:hypothetical protein